MSALSVVSFFPYIVIIPLCIYGNIVLYKNGERVMLKKRSLFLSFGLNISLLFGIVTILNMQLGPYYDVVYVVSFGRTFIQMISWWIILFFLISKNWLILWRYKWQYHTLQLKWQILINKNMNENSNNWYIIHNAKYGQLSYVAKICLICTLFECGCWILMYIFIVTNIKVLVPIVGGIGLLSVLIVIIIYYCIVCKTPHYNDIFYIHWESKMHAKLLIIAGIIFVITAFAFSRGKENNFRMILGSIAFPFMSIILFIMSYISTFGIIKKNKNNGNDYHSQKHNNQHLEEYRVELLLSKENSANLFMTHLSKEFSMECMLAFIEMNQYQRYLIESDGNNVVGDTLKNKVKLTDFASNIPISEIIEGDETKQENHDEKDDLYVYKIKAHKIYKKYVERGSEFEINLPGLVRSNCDDLMNDLQTFLKHNINLNDLVLLFEDCKNEMKVLLCYSLARFKCTNEFEEIKKIFGEEIKKQSSLSNLLSLSETDIVYAK